MVTKTNALTEGYGRDGNAFIKVGDFLYKNRYFVALVAEINTRNAIFFQKVGDRAPKGSFSLAV